MSDQFLYLSLTIFRKLCFWLIIKRQLYIPSQWRYLRCGFIFSPHVGLLAQNYVCFLLNSCSSYHCDPLLQEWVTNISVLTCCPLYSHSSQWSRCTWWPSSRPSWEKFYSKGYRKWWGAPAGSRLHLDPTDRANEILYYCVLWLLVHPVSIW